MTSKKLLWALPLFALVACGHSGNGYYDNSPSAVSTENAKYDTVATDATGAPINSPKRKIIHTADFQCKVQDVFTATTKLEQLVRSVGGVVQESNIDNSAYDTKTAYYTADSLRQTKIYTPTSMLTLRVPSMFLDSIVSAIPGMAVFVDSRKLKQSDVTYQYLANVWKNQVGNTPNTIHSRNNSIAVQQYSDDKQEQKIDRKIANLNMMDDVNYATLTVTFSQPEQVFVQTIVNPEYIAKTPFLLQCKAALNTGFDLIKILIIGCIKIWPLIIMLVATLFIVKWILRRQLVVVKK